jgi:hypothetical protein
MRGTNVARPSQVFFIRNLGFMRPTEARRISFQEALRFEPIHEEVYRRFASNWFQWGQEVWLSAATKLSLLFSWSLLALNG